jgi:hypothetical protein
LFAPVKNFYTKILFEFCTCILSVGCVMKQWPAADAK